MTTTKRTTPARMPVVTNSKLIEAIKNPDDRLQWVEFHRVYRPLVMGVASRMRLGHADVEDVSQEVFNRVAKHIGRFDRHHQDPRTGSRVKFRTWLGKILRNCIIDKQRSLRAGHGGAITLYTENPQNQSSDGGPRKTPVAERLLNKPPLEIATFYEKEWSDLVRKESLARLKPLVRSDHYQAFAYRHTEGKPVEEVCRIMNMTRNTFDQINSRLRSKLTIIVKEVSRDLDNPKPSAKVTKTARKTSTR